jgi:hypothetical protein
MFGGYRYGTKSDDSNQRAAGYHHTGVTDVLFRDEEFGRCFDAVQLFTDRGDGDLYLYADSDAVGFDLHEYHVEYDDSLHDNDEL